jgi:hypothetical protein
MITSVAEPHSFYAAPGETFDAAPLAPTLGKTFETMKIVEFFLIIWVK